MLTNPKVNLLKNWLIPIFIGLNISTSQNSANAFIPYVFEPNEKDLEKISIDFGKVTSQLIYFGQLQEAIRIAKLAVKLNPHNERLWTILASAQIRSDLLNEASISISKAKAINPNNAKLWFTEGTLRIQQNQLSNAISLIEKGLTIEPKNANAYFQLGNARIIQFNFQLALEAFKKASKIESQFWEAINNQGLVLFEIDRTQEAIKNWRSAIKLSKNAEPMLALAAALHQIENNNKESIDLAKKALDQNPSYVSSNYQKEQLWGYKLQEATKDLLNNPSLDDAVDKALENSN